MRDAYSRRQAENIMPLIQSIPQLTLDVIFSVDTPITVEDDIEEEDEVTQIISPVIPQCEKTTKKKYNLI